MRNCTETTRNTQIELILSWLPLPINDVVRSWLAVHRDHPSRESRQPPGGGLSTHQGGVLHVPEIVSIKGLVRLVHCTLKGDLGEPVVVINARNPAGTTRGELLIWVSGPGEGFLVLIVLRPVCLSCSCSRRGADGCLSGDFSCRVTGVIVIELETLLPFRYRFILLSFCVQLGHGVVVFVG